MLCNRGAALACSSTFIRKPPIRYFDRQPPPDRGPRKNEQIRLTPIRLIGAEGEQLGIVPTAQALEKAREAGLDLVEVAPDERPPVCKIVDYGKLRFKNSQKGNKATKVRKQKLKEIRVRPKTGDHDIDTKIAQARKFLEHHDKVQVTVIFRGREMQHQEEGRRVLDNVLAGLAGVGKVERPPAMDGKRMTAMLMPIKALVKPRVNPTAKPALEDKPTVTAPADSELSQGAEKIQPG
jgi:translation initiation factor IF-3